ncbi:hypothetical protein AGMMS49944_18330 [Spirochaetia bacterium]|nr:hypothetical protein AGMMS49944_18330 [Spirochaetia bacterium]
MNTFDMGIIAKNVPSGLCYAGFMLIDYRIMNYEGVNDGGESGIRYRNVGF